MYKILGSALIIIAVMVITTEKLVKNWMLYEYLSEVVITLYELKNNCKLGKSFINSTKKLDIKNKSVFNNFYNPVIEKTEFYLKEIGKRNKTEELEYIQYIINQTERYKEEYRKVISDNKKTTVLTAFSLGIIIVIVLI